MGEFKTRGIIIKQSDYGEGHRMLTIFTEEYGIIKAVSYGVKRAKSRVAASSQFLCYGDFTLYKAHNKDIMTVDGIDTIDGFYPVSENIKKLSLCVYLSDITYSLLGMNNPDIRILHLFLNSIYALAYRNESTEKIKTVYEIKLMCAGGYAPELNQCTSCGSFEIYAFDLLKGGVVCRSCGGKYIIKINKGVYKALSYIASCDDRKMLSFNADDELLKTLGKLSEQFISLQLDQNFPSLDYYKTMNEFG